MKKVNNKSKMKRVTECNTGCTGKPKLMIIGTSYIPLCTNTVKVVKDHNHPEAK